MVEEGMTVLVDAREAEERDDDWMRIEDDVVEVEIDKVIDDGFIHVFLTRPDWGIVMFVERKHIIRTYICSRCGSDKLYYDSREDWFCPWCNDD